MGEIEVGVKVLDLNKNTQALRFFVRDTGIGIPKDQIENVLEKFKQADNSTTREFGGTGLGLSISKMLVELMDGNITIESRLGEGTPFYFDIALPISNANLKNTVSSEALAGEINAIDLGLDIVLNKALKVDFIFMDMQMPVMGGIDCTIAIRKAGYVDLPVIALTANAQQDDRNLCLASGMNDFLTKPIKKEKVIEMLNKWLVKQGASEASV